MPNSYFMIESLYLRQRLTFEKIQQKFGIIKIVLNIIERSLFCSPRLHLFDQKIYFSFYSNIDFNVI